MGFIAYWASKILNIIRYEVNQLRMTGFGRKLSKFLSGSKGKILSGVTVLATINNVLTFECLILICNSNNLP